MHKKYIIGVVMFTFLWTATLIHDQIGFEIAKLSSAITHSIVAEKAPDSRALLISPESCPCAAEHLHSPLVSESLSKEGICALDVRFFSLVLLSSVVRVLASDYGQSEKRVAQLQYYGATIVVGEPLYLLKRSLLI